MKNNIVLICKDLKDKKLLNKFLSLKKHFSSISFEMVSYYETKEFDGKINFLPSWIIDINNITDIVEGDVLISPLRSLIKNKLRKASQDEKK
jgi:hypothetical protein